MPSRRVLLLVVAGVVAIGTVYMARQIMGTTTVAPVAAPPIPVTEILAAARDMPTGTILKDNDVKWVVWPSGASTARLYVKGKNDTANLTGSVLREGVHADETIQLGRAVQPHEQGFLAAVLAPGKRAMSVTLTPSAEVAGFIFPGDHVDVILSHSFSRKDVTSLTERRISETVLTDVRVLALDQKSDNQTAEPKVAALATLEVSPKQAEKLALAADMVGQGGSRGSILLALRSLASDEQASAPPAVVSTDIEATAVSIPQSALALPNPPPNPHVMHGPTWDSDISAAFPSVGGDDGLMQKVQIMRGKETTETNFQRHQ